MGDIKDVRDGTHDSPKYYDKGYPLITSKNLKEWGLDLSEVNYISKEDYISFNKRSQVNIGDILFGMIGTIGNPVLIVEEKFAIKNVALIKENVTFPNIFLIQMLKSPLFNRFIQIENAGGTQKFISLSKIRGFKLFTPSLEEQMKIGKILRDADKTITLLQRKIDNLKKVKKGLLQKLFPLEQSINPQVRFSGFNQDWEQRELGEVVQLINGKAFKQNELLDDGKYRVLRVGNFNTNNQWYYSNLELPKDKYIDKGDLVYLWATTFGPEFWNEEKVIYHYHIWKVNIIDENLDKNYLYSWMKYDKNKILNNTNGSTMIHITKENMDSRKIKFPNIEEQIKIGQIFGEIDRTITLLQKELEMKKQIKKGFLQKLFPKE